MHDSPLWVVSVSGGDLVDNFRSGGLLAIGWKEADQFPADLPDDQMKQLSSRTYPDERPATRAVWLGMVKRFLREIQVGVERTTCRRVYKGAIWGRQNGNLDLGDVKR